MIDTLDLVSRPEVVVYVGMSVDGFVARPDHSLDFLEVDTGGNDLGFADFLDSVDALVMGRTTFDTVIGFDVPWPYGDRPVLVPTHRPLPEACPGTVMAVSGTPDEILSGLGNLGRVYVDGGATVQSFLAAGLVDRLILTTVPVLIGSGIALFGGLEGDIQLDLEAVRDFPNGIVQREYVVRR